MYTTLAKVKDYALKAGSTVSATDDAVLNFYISTVTQRIRHLSSIDFEPQYDTRYMSAWDTEVSSALMSFNLPPRNLLLASSTDVPTITVSSVNYAYGSTILPMPQGVTPIRTLRFDGATGVYNTWYPVCSIPYLDTIVITGWWGYREQYATLGWIASGDSVQDVGGISSSATTITVIDVDGADAYNTTPRFSAGNLIRIDNEAILVLATNTTTNIMTVRRGVNGTTAAAHNQGTSISTWYPEEDIVGAATRQAAMMYSRRGSFEQLTITDVATVQYPRDLLAELYDVVARFTL